MQRAANALAHQLRIKEAQPDPLADKPQLEAQLAAAVGAHFEAQLALARATAAAWRGVRARAALELAQREAEAQVRALEAASTDRRQREAQLSEQVAKVERVLAASRRAYEGARKQAELDAQLDGKARARLDALPSDE